MAIGLTLSPSKVFPTRRVLNLATTVEQLNWDSIWFAESDQADAIGLMHAAAICTEHAVLGSGVIPIQTRPPALVAMGCANLTQLAPGRVRIGVGHSSPNVVGKWCGRSFVKDRAIDQVREFIAAVRACLTGERVEFFGDWHRIDGFRLRIEPASEVKFIVAALGDAMACAAADFADGILMSYIRPERLRQISPVIQERCEEDFTLSVMLNAAVTDSPAETIDAYRRVLVSYSMVDAYAAVFRQSGFAECVRLVREYWDAGDRKAALRAVDDEMVTSLAAIGSVDEVQVRIEELLAAGADEVVLGVIENSTTATAEEVVKLISIRD